VRLISITGSFRQGRSVICCAVYLVASKYNPVYRDIDLLLTLWIFPADFVVNLVVTPLPDCQSRKDISFEENILQLHSVNDIIMDSSKGSYAEHPSRNKFLPESSTKESSSSTFNNKTWSRRVFKPETLKQKDLRKRYQGVSNMQDAKVRKSLQKARLILYAIWVGV